MAAVAFLLGPGCGPHEGAPAAPPPSTPAASPSRHVGTGAAAGEPAPPFDLQKVGGGRLSLADLRGKAVVLSFWMPG